MKNNKARFINWEINNVLGAYVGCAKMYGMVAGMWCIAAAVLTMTGWADVDYMANYGIMNPFGNAPVLQVCCCTGLAMIWKFCMMEVNYRRVTKCPKWKHFCAMGTVALLLYVWRLIRFVAMTPDYKLGMIIGSGIVLIAYIISAVCIMTKGDKLNALSEKIQKIRVFVEKNPDFVWAEGADKPE